MNGISTCDFLIACTDSDETNIVISTLAKSIGCKKVIARVRDPEYMNHMDSIKEYFSIDYTVNPDLAITNEIYKYLVEKYTLTNGIFTSGKVALVQFKVRKYRSLIGLTMIEVAKVLPNMLVAAISRNGKIIIPHGDTKIEENDYVYLVGERNEITAIHSQVYERGKYTNLQKVMIIGGGKTGFYLAEKLSDYGASVKIVERDKNRCFYLSTHLDDVMVLNAEGDAFVATSGPVKIQPFRAYFSMPDTDHIALPDTDPTGLTEATADSGIYDDTVYNLSGQRVVNPRRGIYIKNHKKVLIW